MFLRLTWDCTQIQPTLKVFFFPRIFKIMMFNEISPQREVRLFSCGLFQSTHKAASLWIRAKGGRECKPGQQQNRAEVGPGSVKAPRPQSQSLLLEDGHTDKAQVVHTVLGFKRAPRYLPSNRTNWLRPTADKEQGLVALDRNKSTNFHTFLPLSTNKHNRTGTKKMFDWDSFVQTKTLFTYNKSQK